MIEYNYTDQDFFEYLNRHLTGFILLGQKLKSIIVKYELAEAYSNHSCRFIIDIEFLNFENLSIDEKKLAHKFFHNSQNSTGGGFISFIYKSQREYHIDIVKIQSFVQHYEFAKQTLNGVIKNVIPENCELEIKDLKMEPLFTYMDRFFGRRDYSLSDGEFTKKYEDKFKTSFDFDIIYHNRILNQALKYSDLIFENSISDKELEQNHFRSIEEIRRFVLDNDIPFIINKYRDTIEEIYIDEGSLKEKLTKNILPVYNQLQKNVIIKVIEKKEQERKVRLNFLNKLVNDSNLSIGDFILITENYYGDKCQEIGIIKEFEINYNNCLEIKYNQLKINLEESKIGLKTIALKKIKNFIPAIEMKRLRLLTLPKGKPELFMFLKKNAQK
ncbi:MAG: hypothetical protein H7Y10_01785 [Flavobacterium sp.]|nr:hypothetical protein [Flavobacterium sp.]